MKRARLDFFAETHSTQNKRFLGVAVICWSVIFPVTCERNPLLTIHLFSVPPSPFDLHPTATTLEIPHCTHHPRPTGCGMSVRVCMYVEQVVPMHKYCRQKQAGWRIRSKYCRREKHEPREAVKAAAKSLCSHVVSYHKMLAMSGNLLRYTNVTDNLGPICPKTLVWHGRSPVAHNPELFVSCACANHCLHPSFAIPPRMPLSQAMDERRCTQCLLTSETNGVLSLSTNKNKPFPRRPPHTSSPNENNHQNLRKNQEITDPNTLHLPLQRPSARSSPASHPLDPVPVSAMAA